MGLIINRPQRTKRIRLKQKGNVCFVNKRLGADVVSKVVSDISGGQFKGVFDA